MSHPLQLSCPQCGVVLQARDSSDQGKEVRCPKCKEVFRLQLLDGENSRNLAERQVQLTTIRKRSLRFTIFLVVILVGIAGGIASLFYDGRSRKTGTALDLTYLPANTDLVVQLKVGQTLRSELLTDVMATPFTQAMITLLQTQTSLSIHQIESVTVGVVLQQGTLGSTIPLFVAPTGQPFAVTVLRGTSPFDVEQIVVKSLKGSLQSHSGKMYYRVAVPGGFPVDSVYFPEPHIAVVGAEAAVQAAIRQGNARPHIPDFDFVDASPTFVLAVKTEAIGSAPIPGLPTSNLQALQTDFKANLQTAMLAFTISNKIELNGTINCHSESGATTLVRTIESNLGDAKTQLKKHQNVLKLAGFDDAVQVADNSLNSITVIRTGQKIEIQGTIPESLRAAIAKALSAFTPAIPASPLPSFVPALIPTVAPLIPQLLPMR